MKPETRAIRDAAKLLAAGRSESYVLGWTKAGGFGQAEAKRIVEKAKLYE